MNSHLPVQSSSNFNSLFLHSDPQLDEDSRQAMLKAEYEGTKEMLLAEYEKTSTEYLQTQQISHNETIKLKRELDRLGAHNLALSRKLQDMKNRAETLEKQIITNKSSGSPQPKFAQSSAYSSRSRFVSTIQEEALDYGDSIHKKIEKIEAKQAEEEAEAESLKNMQQGLKQSALIWKERLTQALEMHKSVLVNHDKLAIAKNLAVNNFLTTQKEVKSFRSKIQRDKFTYRTEYNRHKNIKEEEERKIENLISKISMSNLDVKRKNQVKDSMLSVLEERITQLEEDKHFRSDLFRQVEDYRQKLTRMREMIAGIDIELDISEPIKSVTTHTLINTFKQLKYQEDSLSIRFQELTVEYSIKQKQCEDIKTELSLLKDDNMFLSDRRYAHETYNHIRSSLDTEKELQNRQELASSSEKVCIKLYLQLLNILTVLCNSVSTIHENSIDNSSELLSCQANLKQLIDNKNKGFSPKKSEESRKEVSKFGMDSMSVFQTELPEINLTNEVSKVEMRDSVTYFSLSFGEIKDAYLQALGDRSSADNFAKILKEVRDR